MLTRSVADLHNKILDTPLPPWGPKFFQFHAIFGEIWQNHMLAPPGELVPPRRRNPGSATGVAELLLFSYKRLLQSTFGICAVQL